MHCNFSNSCSIIDDGGDAAKISGRRRTVICRVVEKFVVQFLGCSIQKKDTTPVRSLRPLNQVANQCNQQHIESCCFDNDVISLCDYFNQDLFQCIIFKMLGK